MITLYYIQGLTRLDEPYFDKLANQETFFDTYKVVSIDSGFYPPHFHNTIELSTDDVNITGNINYLSLVYLDKTYYYFIDKIEYVSEDVIRLYITLDTIQSFMFNIKFIDSLVTRLSINRWYDKDNLQINRDYLRENISQGKFVTNKYNYSLPDISWYIVWIRGNTGLYYRSGYNPDTEEPIYTELPIENVMTLSNGKLGKHYRKASIYCTPLCIPVSNDPSYSNVTMNGSPSNPDFSHLCEDPNVIKIVRVDKDIFADYFTDVKANGAHNLTWTGGTSVRVLYPLYWKDASNKYNYITTVLMPESLIKAPTVKSQSVSNVDLPLFVANEKKGQLFNARYVPAMLDENYIHVYYGEQMSYITYPLHQLDKPEFWYVNVTDWLSGTRIYGIMSSEYKGDFTDPYTNIGVCNTQEYIDLYNDAWLNYYSRNTASWTMGYQLNKQKILYSYYMGSAKNIGNTLASMAGAQSNINIISEMADFEYWDMNMLQSRENSKGSMIGSAIKGLTNQVGLVGDYFQSNYALDEQRKIIKGDYEATPDTEKQGNTLTADTLMEATMTIKKLDVVDDYENVARTYERLGYKVAKRLNNINLFDYAWEKRYYYNCITADIYEMSLINYITDEATMTNIKQRFSSGLRLWSTLEGKLCADYIGDFRYDNVEMEYL